MPSVALLADAGDWANTVHHETIRAVAVGDWRLCVLVRGTHGLYLLV